MDLHSDHVIRKSVYLVILLHPLGALQLHLPGLSQGNIVGRTALPCWLELLIHHLPAVKLILCQQLNFPQVCHHLSGLNVRALRPVNRYGPIWLQAHVSCLQSTLTHELRFLDLHGTAGRESSGLFFIDSL